MKDPYAVILKRLVTEKSKLMEELQHKTSNKSLARFKSAKYVFVVDPRANKIDIAKAIEEIYKELEVKVVKVNTMHVKTKPKQRGRTRPGGTPTFKKAIVTLEEGDSIEDKG